MHKSSQEMKLQLAKICSLEPPAKKAMQPQPFVFSDASVTQTISDFSSLLFLCCVFYLQLDKMPRRHQQQIERARGGNAVYDTGSSLYDSYELDSVNRILDRHLAGPPSPDESQRKGPGAPPTEEKNKRVVVFGARRKVTLRALFRGVASWAVRPTRRRRACIACVCAAPARSSAVGSDSEPVV
uniref:Uncharacterized protein n=1 Tax=Avena sativa TaxID=4498 RepID=A0ACD5VMD8_AVESA